MHPYYNLEVISSSNWNIEGLPGHQTDVIWGGDAAHE